MQPLEIELLSAGCGATLQDQGRAGWRRYGVPPGGPMDEQAADCANRLLNNPPDAAVLELLLQGARLRALSRCWVAITGADAQATHPTWRALCLEPGEIVEAPSNRAGVWTYLALEGGFAGTDWLGERRRIASGEVGWCVRPQRNPPKPAKAPV